VIQSDFANTLTTTKKAEGDAEKKFVTFETDTTTDINNKGSLKTTQEGKRTNAKLDIKNAEANLRLEDKSLKTALEELVKLKPVCVDSGMSWEERTARREQEVEALKEGLKILQNTDFSA